MRLSPAVPPARPASHAPKSRLASASIITAFGALLVIIGGLAGPGASAATVTPGVPVSAMNLPYPSESGTCDPTRDGWHLVMNQVATSTGTAPGATDFAPVELAFADGSSATATFTDMSGLVAHFLYVPPNPSTPLTLVTATMTFPGSTTVVSFGRFVVSHPPCGSEPTTTTTNPVTTETLPTTTTNPVTTETLPTTTTTNPVTTETLPTTTRPSDTTEQWAVSAASPSPGDGPSGPAGGTRASTGLLPGTGAEGTALVVVGLLIMTSGIAVWVIGRRRQVV